MTLDLEKLVVHCKKSRYDVYVGRPGPWGNPWSHLDDSVADEKCATREEAIARYEEMIMSDPEMIAIVKRELKGKVLGCWCAPKPCHGHVLVRIANEE